MPTGIERDACAFALGAWLGVGASPSLAVVGVVVLIALVRRRVARIALVALASGVVVGAIGARTLQAAGDIAAPAGVVRLQGVAVGDPAVGWGRDVVVLVRPRLIVVGGALQPWQGLDVLVRGAGTGILAGEPVLVTGAIDPSVASYRGRPIAGVIRSGTVARLGGASNPILASGNALRRRVLGSLDSVAARPEGALLSGFLIGDVSRLPARDEEALRAAGLSHFVAVSGSNVALFLGAWWLVSGPLGIGPRRRAVWGMIGVGVFVVVTRWEPSVVRAALMATLVLLGRLSGRPVGPWTALGGATGIALLIAPGLAGSFGFALSVAATAGIIAGTGLWVDRRPRPVWAVLAATVSAQVAVAPLLFLWFGRVPLLAPVSNLLAAPLVALSTGLGGMGTILGLRGLVEMAADVARLVLIIARVSADLPQVGRSLALPLLVGVVVVVRFAWARPVGLGLVVAAIVAGLAPARPPSVPTVSFLDVAQGDATLFRGPAGETILVDGGPDPAVLRSHLRRFGVDRIDLVIVSHRHADHVIGLTEVLETIPVGIVWHAPQLGEGPVLDELIAQAQAAGIPTASPRPGDTIRLGAFLIEARAPLRRYAGTNDGSLVVEVRVGEVTVMMTGDIEAHAQYDVGPLRATIMKVPHQGSATSDLEWLVASAPAIAIVSVGPNEFGHPAPEVVAALRAAGSRVMRTDLDGTISIPLVAELAQQSLLASPG